MASIPYLPRIGWNARSVPSLDLTLGTLIGLVLPLMSVALYRTYDLAVTPAWLETTRQLGIPFAIAEFGIVAYARRHGFDPLAAIKALPAATRCALLIFLSTFWISSLLVSPHISFSLTLCLILTLHLYTGAAAFHLVRFRRFAPIGLAAGTALGLAVLTPIFAIHFGFPPAGHGPSTWIFGGPTPGFISIRLFGAWAGIVLTLLFGIAWQNESGARTWWIYPAIALATGLIVWSGTRAAVLGVLVALAAAFVLTRGRHVRGFWPKAMLAIIIGSAVVPLLLPGGTPLFLRAGDGSVDISTSGRLELWEATLAVAVHRPLLGHGMATNWWLVPLQGFYHVQPHNALIQFFMNWGVIPTLAALFMLGTIVVKIHSGFRRARNILPLIMAIDFFLTASLLDGLMYFTDFLMMFAILAGACLAILARSERA